MKSSLFVKLISLSIVLGILPIHNLFARPLEKAALTQYKIGIVVGSIRKDSFNAKIAKAIIKLAPENFSFNLLKIDDLPLYNQDYDLNQAKSVKRLKAEIAASTGILFITPEYNWSIPGVLKNAIDHASRPYGNNAWAGKPAGIIGASLGKTGTAIAQQHLRSILTCLDMPIMAQPTAFIHITEDFFDKNGEISINNMAFLQKWLNNYVAWIKAHNKASGTL